MKDDRFPTAPTLTEAFGAPARQTLHIDVEKYQAYLDGSNMTDADKHEYLKALWSIIINFVDLGFGVHPLQESCGQNPGTSDQRPCAAFSPLGSLSEDKVFNAPLHDDREVE